MRIYKFYRFRWIDAWYQLSSEEQQATLDKIDTVRDQVGGHTIVECEAGWATDSWHGFGIEEYPNMESVRQHRRLLEDMNWFRYIECESMLGTCISSR